MNERVKKLRQESLDTQPYISIQRASLVTEAYKKYEGTATFPELCCHTLEDPELINERGKVF